MYERLYIPYWLEIIPHPKINNLFSPFPQLPRTTLAIFYCCPAECDVIQFQQAKRKPLIWPLQRKLMQLQPSHLHRFHEFICCKDSHFGDF